MASKLELLNLISQQVGGNAPAASELAAWQAIQASKLSIIGIQKSISGSTNETELQVIQDLVFQQGGSGEAETVLDNLNEWAGILGVPDVPSEWDYEGELTAGSVDIGEGNYLKGYVNISEFATIGSIIPSPIHIQNKSETLMIAHPFNSFDVIGLCVSDGENGTANEIEIDGTSYILDEYGFCAMETSPFADGVTYSIKLR